MSTAAVSHGQVIGGRYRLERPLAAEAGSPQGDLWLASDLLAAEAPSALRRVGPERDQARMRELWARLQGVLHPQVPRFGAAIAEGDQLWLVRDWQAGRTFRQLLEARRERQLVFGAGEVLLLLRQLLPVLAALHSQDLLHGDLSPDNLLRRDSDGLPVLLDFGLVRGTAVPVEGEIVGATPGYAPPELVRGEAAQPWMDLHALGVVALVLISGDDPAALLDPGSLEWRRPAALEAEPALWRELERLLSRDASRRFASAAQALAALQALPMPDSTGPVPRADRTVVLVPPVAAPVAEVPDETEAPLPAAAQQDAPEAVDSIVDPPGDGEPEAPPTPEAGTASTAQQAAPSPDGTAAQLLPPLAAVAVRRRQRQEEDAEGGLWPVLIALVLSAIAGTALGWWWLSRGQAVRPQTDAVTQLPSSLPPAEIDQRQLLLNRLQALQIDKGWFLRLVDANLLAQYPERRGRLPSDAPEDAPLRRVWNTLAEEWLARVEQLPLPIRRRLGGFSTADWDRRQAGLVNQGLSPDVLRLLVSGSAQNLLPGRAGQDIPPEPFRQLWYAAAEMSLQNLRIDPIVVSSQTAQMVSAEVPASGARLFPIRLPQGYSLALGVNGTPLLQMSVFAADGRPIEPRGPLRVVNLGPQKSSPVQLLVVNDGVAGAEIQLQLRADPPVPPPPTATPPAGPTPSPGEPTAPSPGTPAPATPAAGETPAPAAPAAPATPPAEPPRP